MIIKFKQLERPRDFCQSFFVFANWTEKCRISMLSRHYFDLNFAGRPTLLNGRNWLFAGATLELEHWKLRHISKWISQLIFYKLQMILFDISVWIFKIKRIIMINANSMKNWVVLEGILHFRGPLFELDLRFNPHSLLSNWRRFILVDKQLFSIFHQNLEFKAEKSPVHHYHSA